ncbi:MAG: hypothetical protein V3T21_02850 [Candidatus Margulisiibacteriota bacterium]
MGKFADVSVVSGNALCRRNDHVLFRPVKKGKKQKWREIYSLRNWEELFSVSVLEPNKLPIPTFLYPERAEIKPFYSISEASQESRKEWSETAAREFSETIFSPFFDILNSVYGYRPAVGNGYGVHGLYTKNRDKRILQGMHALIPFVDPETGDPLPLMAACIKAPWNTPGFEMKGVESWRQQYWGIDLAILVHSIRTFYKNMPYSFGEQAVSSWRVGLLLPVPCSPHDPHIQYHELLGYLNSLDNPELRADINLFGIDLERIEINGLGIFPNLGKEWMAYGFRIDGQTAERLVQTYYKWMDHIFETTNLI